MGRRLGRHQGLPAFQQGRRLTPESMVAPQKDVNRSHSRIRALGERALATLKTWKVLPNCAAAPGSPMSAASRSCHCLAGPSWDTSRTPAGRHPSVL
jgi:hypothetical protein